MTSYQKLKRKCDYLESQVNIFKHALTIVRQEPKIVKQEVNEHDDLFISLEMAYSVTQNRIEEQLIEELQKWVAFNLDEEAIKRLLKLKEELESEK